MSAPKHTPGPWVFEPADDTPGYREPAAVQVGSYRWRPIARVYEPSQTEADGNLIAAAPDMLEALREMIAASGPEAGEVDRRLALKDARIAIAKAEGRA